MSIGRNKFCALVLAMVVAMSMLAVYGLQNTPYHYQKTGVNIENYSQFTGSVPGQGSYKATKGRYIKQAWVSVKDGSYSKKVYSSSASSKSDSTVRSATINKVNNPVKSQTLNYNWVYR